MAVSAEIEILTGDRGGTRVRVAAGATMRIGRMSPAEIIIPDDPLLSALHFSIHCGTECRIRDLGSRFGTFRRGEKAFDVALVDGDEIHAGRSRFRIVVQGVPEALSTAEATAAPIEPVPLPGSSMAYAPGANGRAGAIRDFLSTFTDPLYAVLDAAREPSVPERLARYGGEFQSLYDGPRGEELAPFGPWLARIQPWSDELTELVAEGWGGSWGVYLTCSQPFAEVRKHLRRFLLVNLPDGRQVYFRYYDPRVLRTYLPTCTPAELTHFFGPIKRCFAESSDEDCVLEFASNHRDWKKQRLA